VLKTLTGISETQKKELETLTDQLNQAHGIKRAETRHASGGG
jgi:hypothetical protein